MMAVKNHTAIDIYEATKQFWIGDKADIEALTGVTQGSFGFATDTGAEDFGYYDGAAWVWLSDIVDGKADVTEPIAAAHIGDTVDAHDASAISNVPAGNISSTDVQAAINELDGEKASVSEPIAAAHIADTTDAHAGSAITNTPAGNISATTVQSAINELDTEKQPLDSDLTTIAALTPTDDDVLQRKSGAWTSRSMVQLKADLNLEDSDITSLVQTLLEDLGFYDNWFPDSNTWTRTGNHTYTIAGDHTGNYRKGTFIRYKDGGAFEYGVVHSSSFASSTTTINLIPNTNYAMAAVTITDTAYCNYGTPADFPDFFDWAAAPTGFSSVPSSPVYRWKADSKVIHYEYLEGTNGTSNATTFTASLPVAPIQSLTVPLGTTVDNNVVQTTPGRVVLTAGSTTITFRKDTANAAWTNSLGKRAVVILAVEY